MKIELTERINKPIIIEGFPGFGLIGTIATEFLIEHLDTKQVGKFWFEDASPSIALHQGKMIYPVGIFYDKTHNFLIIHSISSSQGLEWKGADLVNQIAAKVNAKEIISLEGVGTNVTDSEDSRVFYHASDKGTEEKLRNMNIEELKEGIIVGITSAILMKSTRKVTCFFAETHSALPDSKAAAKVVEALDKYLGISLNIKPLMEQAEKLEGKLKDLIQKNQQTMDLKEQKQLNYVG